MKRPIKFRGRWLGTGELVYGSYCRMFYCDVGAIHTITDEGGEEFTVEPESVVQLVGYDRDGNEIYEGDTVVGQRGFEFTARFVGNISSTDTLKEAKT